MFSFLGNESAIDLEGDPSNWRCCRVLLLGDRKPRFCLVGDLNSSLPRPSNLLLLGDKNFFELARGDLVAAALSDRVGDCG